MTLFGMVGEVKALARMERKNAAITKRNRMDHKEQHHLKHQKEREHEKKEHQKHEREAEKKRLPLHPAWLFVVAAVLALVAVLLWTFFLS